MRRDLTKLMVEDCVVKRLTVTLLVFGAFTLTVFAQTVEQTEPTPSPGCIEIIRGTERHLQCANVITATAEQTGKKSSGRKRGKAQAKRLTSELHKARRSTPNSVLFVVPVPGRQIRDFEDSPEGPNHIGCTLKIRSSIVLSTA